MYLVSRVDRYGCDILDTQDGCIDYCSVSDINTATNQGIIIDGVSFRDNKIFLERSRKILGNVYDDTTNDYKNYLVVGYTEQYCIVSNMRNLFIMSLRDIYKNDLVPATSLPMTARKIKIKRVENYVQWVSAGELNIKTVMISAENTLEDICDQAGVVYKPSNWYNTSYEQQGRIIGYGCKATNRSCLDDCYRYVIVDIGGVRKEYNVDYFNSLQRGRKK